MNDPDMNDFDSDSEMEYSRSADKVFNFNSLSGANQLSKIEAALDLNKQVDEELQRLEEVLKRRLLECRARLENAYNQNIADNIEEGIEMDNNVIDEDDDKKDEDDGGEGSSKYGECGSVEDSKDEGSSNNDMPDFSVSSVPDIKDKT